MTLSAFDLDGTLFSLNTSFAFSRYLHKRGLFSFSQLLYCAFAFSHHLLLKSQIEYLHRRTFNFLLKGREVNFFKTHVDPFIDYLFESHLFKPARDRLEAARARGDRLMLLSASPNFLVGPLAERFGIDEWHATHYTIDNEECLWDIENVIDGPKKAALIASHKGERIAYSDSLVDLPFLEAANSAVAVRPDRRLRSIAHQRGWEMLG